MAYLRIVTHPSLFDAPLGPADAVANVEALLALPHVRAVGEPEKFWDTFRTVNRSVVVRGNLVPDAHLVALMHAHGVSTIWSRDRDLRRFDGITVLDPFSADFTDGFG
jgi:uncharacterized protein